MGNQVDSQDSLWGSRGSLNECTFFCMVVSVSKTTVPQTYGSLQSLPLGEAQRNAKLSFFGPNSNVGSVYKNLATTASSLWVDYNLR